MHQHTTDLSARVHRWRATPHALPVIVRDHHAGGSTDPILPLTPQRSHKRFSGPLVAALSCTALIYIASGIVLGLHAAGRI